MDDWEGFLSDLPASLDTLSVSPQLCVTERLLFCQQTGKMAFLPYDLETILTNGVQSPGLYPYLEDHWEGLEAVAKEGK